MLLDQYRLIEDLQGETSTKVCQAGHQTPANSVNVWSLSSCSELRTISTVCWRT